MLKSTEDIGKENQYKRVQFGPNPPVHCKCELVLLFINNKIGISLPTNDIIGNTLSRKIETSLYYKNLFIGDSTPLNKKSYLTLT